MGASGDAFGYGAAWIFTRNAGTWVQQGPKLRPASLVKNPDNSWSYFGNSIALSGNGGTLWVGGYNDASGAGAVWPLVRSGNTWSEGPKLTALDESGAGRFGYDVALSAAGDAALIGGDQDAGGRGAVWGFARSGGTWSQQGAKVTGPNNPVADGFGRSVALDAAGDSALVGAGIESGSSSETSPEARGNSSAPPAHGTPTARRSRRQTARRSCSSATTLDSVPMEPARSSSPPRKRGRRRGVVFAEGTPPVAAPQVFGSFYDPDITSETISVSAHLYQAVDPLGTFTFRIYPQSETPHCWGMPLAVKRVALSPTPDGEASTTIALPGYGEYRGTIAYSGDAKNAATRMPECDVVDGRARPTTSARVTGDFVVGGHISITPRISGGAAPSGTLSVRVWSPRRSGCSRDGVVLRT